MNLKCKNCASEKIMANVPVLDQGQQSDGYLKALVGVEKPEAILFKKPIYATLRANICSVCGHTELFAEDAAKLYEAYLKWEQQGRPLSP